MLVTFEDDFLDLPTHNLRIFVCMVKDIVSVTASKIKGVGGNLKNVLF